MRHELRKSPGWLAGLSQVPRSELYGIPSISFHLARSVFSSFFFSFFFQSTFVVKPAPLGVALRASEIVCLEGNAGSFPLKRCPDLWEAHDQPHISQAAKRSQNITIAANDSYSQVF